MRTPIATRFNDSLTAIQRHARQVADEQSRLSGGTKLLRASDSPMAIGRAVDLRTSSAHLDALKRLQDTADSRMSEAEQAMADAAQVLDEFHQLWVQTQNGALGGAQLQAFNLQAKSLQEELQQILTRADSRGYRLFDATDLDVVIGGASNGVGPVKINTVGGVGGLRVLNPSLDEGWEKDQTLDEAVDLIVFNEDSLVQKFVDALANGERIELEDLNFLEASRAMIHERIYLGANQARLERARVRVENVQVATKTSLAEEVDTDYAKSTMEVQKAKALMEAAQTISAQIGTMNLFQKLG